MKMIKNIDPQFWLDVAQNCDYATFFHTPYWHNLAVTNNPHYRDDTVGIILDNGTRVVLPLLVIDKIGQGLFKNTISTFEGCYGGLIADKPITYQDEQAIYQAVCRGRTGQIHVTSNPIAPHHPTDIEANDFTHLLELNQPAEAIFRNFSKGHRSAIKKGKREGVTTRIAHGLEDYRAYYAVYENTLSRWGDKANTWYPWEFFLKLYDMAEEHPQNVQLRVAEVEGVVVSGAILFYWNQHVDYWHGATHADYFSYKPSHVLQMDIITHACELGCRYYDFNPSGGQEGVAKFKNSFATTKLPIWRWSQTNRLLQTASSIKNIFRRDTE